jgi:hypothetical protein
MGILEAMPVDALCIVSDSLQTHAPSLHEQVGIPVVKLIAIQHEYLSLHASSAQVPDARPSNVIGAQPEDPVTSIAALGAAWAPEQLVAWQEAGLSIFPQPFGIPQLVGAQLNGSSLISATGAQCGETVLHGSATGPLVVWLTQPHSLEDAWDYWNFRTLIPLRLSTIPSCLLPLPCDEPSTVQLLIEASCRSRPYLSEPDVVVFSRSIDATAAMDFMSTVGVRQHDGHNTKITWPGPSRDMAAQPLTALFADPTPQVAARRALGLRTVVPTYLRRTKTIVSVDSPVRFRRFGGQVRVGFSGPPAFAVPQSSSAAKLFDPNALIAQGRIEIATRPANHYILHMDVPNRKAILSAYLDDRGLHHELSDKGGFAAGVLNAIPGVSQLRNPIALAVIDALTTHRFAYELKEARKQLPGMDDDHLDELIRSLRSIRQVSRTLEQIFAEVKKANDPLTRRDVGAALGALTDVRMLFRGLQVACDLCRIASFVEMQEASAPPACPGCGSPASYSPDPFGQPAIHYRLNALLELASENGVLGHVILDAALRDLFGYEDVVNLPGVNLAVSGQKAHEADSLALINEHIWLGEVKPHSHSFSDEQIERDLALADTVGAQTYLIVCLKGLEDDRIHAALLGAVKRGMQLALLEAADGRIRILTKFDLPADVGAATAPSDNTTPEAIDTTPEAIDAQPSIPSLEERQE